MEQREEETANKSCISWFQMVKTAFCNEELVCVQSNEMSHMQR